MATGVKLIVGLGNPGPDYEDTRHNVGFWFVSALARRQGVSLAEDRKAFGITGQFRFQGETIRLLLPTTYMNLSGQATAAVANFYRIQPAEMLVAHDELDIPPGSIRLKQGGGHGGHNGLRDIIRSHGNQKNFIRLRIGIGHPGDSQRVTPHVLSKPSTEDRQLIEQAIEASLDCLDDVLEGELSRAMNRLNGLRA